MATAASPRQMMYAQVVSQPALLLDVFDTAEQAVSEAFSQVQPQRWQGIYTAGCGDSFYAGLACEMAFARFCRLPVKALSSMQFARYEADTLLPHAVLFGISNSGHVSRSIEAVSLARAAGIDTIAVTGNGTSGIAREASAAVAVPIPAMGRSPGIRSYTVQLLSLYLCALRLGEVRQVLSPTEAQTWRQRLRAVASCMEATIKATDEVTQQLAERFKTADHWVFMGSGPSYATAMFIAAKLVESCGANAWGQDIEEWAHIQFFNQQEQTPTWMIMPPGRSIDRALELLPYVKGIGRPTTVVASSEQAILPTQADVVLPVVQPVPEVFSALVYCLAGELLAYYLAEGRGADFFQATRSFRSSGDRLRESHTVRQPEALARMEEAEI
ncbi:MAG: SIS domain-containing protein [Candidatus Tectomicrobia bacterium]|uniref:Glutamine--fructose-6-phosphate aminotransferase [isomerizing] n=1 Tax=Tectimicrobiota bacterium TaxID=2528274 RepID=A0A937W2H8_UNCTE|nr:SIS domain-containing protein [Candidatus Tectomicrobia bacterium]